MMFIIFAAKYYSAHQERYFGKDWDKIVSVFVIRIFYLSSNQRIAVKLRKRIIFYPFKLISCEKHFHGKFIVTALNQWIHP